MYCIKEEKGNKIIFIKGSVTCFIFFYFLFIDLIQLILGLRHNCNVATSARKINVLCV